MGLLPFQDLLQLLLQLAAFLIAQCVIFGLGAGQPVAEECIGQLAQGGLIEAVVVDEDGETILQPVPDVPQERALAEEGAVLAEGTVAHPRLERAVAGRLLVEHLVGFGDQAAFKGIGPVGAECCGEISAQTVGQRLLSGNGRNAEQSVSVAGWKLSRLRYPGARVVGDVRLRIIFVGPAVTAKPSKSNMYRRPRSRRCGFP